MLGISLKDKIPNREIRRRTGVFNTVRNILPIKCNGAGPVCRRTDGQKFFNGDQDKMHTGIDDGH